MMVRPLPVMLLRPLPPAVLPMILLLGLAACSAPQQTLIQARSDLPPNPAPAPAAPVAAAPVKPPPRPPLRGTGGKPVEIRPESPVPPEAPAAQAPALPQKTEIAALPAPVRVIGQSAASVRQKLGEPASQRTQGPARIWRYQARDCRVDVYFYLDTARGDFYALDQRLEGTAKSAELCLGSLNGG